MPSAATIGALRVVLGADTAAFSSGLKSANSDLAKFAKGAGVAAAAIATAFVAVGAALGVAVKNVLDDMDKVAKAAQQIGIPVEQLTKLRYAAELSGVSFEELVKSTGKLSKAMGDIAQGAKGPAAAAFAQLGVAVKNSDGTLRSTNEVLLDLADRFAGIPDGATKTKLAMDLFGKTGAALIPLLNGGAAGLKAMGDEAAKLGITFDTQTAKNAERFNDSLTTLGKLLDGVLVQLTSSLAQPLANVAEYFKDAAINAGGFGEVGQKVGETVIEIAKVVIDATGALIRFADAIRLIATAVSQVKSGELTKAWETLQTVPGKGVTEFLDGLKDSLTALPKITFEGMWADLGKGAPVLTNLADQAKATALAQQELNKAIGDGVNLANAALSPWDEYQKKLADLQVALDHGKISAEQMANAHVMAAANATQPWLQVASTVGGALGQLFEDNKAVAIAQAIINTAQGITAALAQWGATPIGIALAAATAAAGAVQIATIKSTRPGSSSRPSVGSGNGKAAVSGDNGGAAPATQDRAIFVHLVGEGLLSTEQVRGLITQINDAVKDGAKIEVSRA